MASEGRGQSWANLQIGAFDGVPATQWVCNILGDEPQLHLVHQILADGNREYLAGG